MLLFTLIRHGFARAARHPGAVFLLFLAGLVPALLVASLISADLAPALDSSRFASRLLEGNSLGVWIDFQRSDGADLQPVGAVLGGRFLLVILLQILVAAGLVEVLLERSGGQERPFLAGIGRHGFRFVRSALVFGFLLLLALLLVSPVSWLFEDGDDRWGLLGSLVELTLLYLVYLVLHTAYDFSRIAAAAHGDGRMVVGFFKALGFTFRKLHVLLPLGLFFTLLLGTVQASGFALRSQLEITTGGGVFGWLVAQQALFFVLAYLRTSLWGAEVAYFQGLGEPRFCGRKSKQPAPPPSLVREAPKPAPEPAAPSKTPAETRSDAPPPTEPAPAPEADSAPPARASDEPSPEDTQNLSRLGDTMVLGPKPEWRETATPDPDEDNRTGE